jgi:hypothetical protein
LKSGSFKVLLLNDDNTATLDDSGVDFQISSFFYAVEEERYFDPIKVLSRQALKPRTSIPFAVRLKQRKKEGGKVEDEGCLLGIYVGSHSPRIHANDNPITVSLN